jgi:hypothetical protein
MTWNQGEGDATAKTLAVRRTTEGEGGLLLLMTAVEEAIQDAAAETRAVGETGTAAIATSRER